jgi:hypothetical protein
MAEVRFFIQSTSISRTEVTPVWKGLLRTKREREQVYYTEEMRSEMLFKMPDYNLINGLANDCEEITLDVERKCSGSWTLRWQGTFSKQDCKINVDQCALRVTPKAVNVFKCLFEKWETVTNIYAAGATITSRAFFGEYFAEPCVEFNNSPAPIPVSNCINPAQWCATYESNNVTFDTASGQYKHETIWHRIEADGTCSGGTAIAPAFDTGWVLLSSTCPTASRWWRCPVGYEAGSGVHTRGRKFNDVLTYLVSQLSCGLTVQSHFFGINPPGTGEPSNIAYTFAAAKLRKMTLHQKSDVKRPFSSNGSLSFIWTLKLKALLDDLRKMFNVFFTIENGKLIIEHVSYFTTIVGPDFTAKPQKLEYDNDDDIPKEEKFQYLDADCYPFFAGTPIKYPCGEDVKDIRLTLFSTDLAFITDPDNKEKVSDEGWVLICNAQDTGGNYFIIEANQPLSWTNLHANLHKHYRPFLTGTMNGATTTFLSAWKNRKQEPFTVQHCCDDTFDPYQLITTPLGDGQVQEAEYNLYQDSLKLNLSY